jgi:hypothetical protein
MNKYKVPWQTFEKWNNYGLENRYDEINPNIIKRSKKKIERSWYAKGIREGWTKTFKFAKIKNYSIWKTKKCWKSFGLRKKYDQKAPKELQKSKEKIERSWLQVGYVNDGAYDFNFYRDKARSGTWKSIEFVLGETKRFLSRYNLSDLPSRTIIEKLGHSSLGYAISKYHGGFRVFREKLNECLRGEADNKLESFLEDYVSGGSEDE